MTGGTWPAEFPLLSTRRLSLREPRASDADAVFDWKSDPLVTGPYGAEPYASVTQAKEWVANRLENFRQQNGIMWLLAGQTDDVAIGSACFWHFEPDLRCAELGYELGRPSWGRGLAREAVSELVRYGFSELGLHRIEACPLAANAPSIRLLEAVGFSLEGRLRERVGVDDRFEDQLYFGLLRRDWSGDRSREGVS